MGGVFIIAKLKNTGEREMGEEKLHLIMECVLKTLSFEKKSYMKFENLETEPFTIAMERIKYLGIYLPKETKDL